MENAYFPVIDSTLSPAHIAAGNEEYVLRVYNRKHRDIRQVTAETDVHFKIGAEI